MDAVQELYQHQILPLTPDARFHLAELILRDLNDTAGHLAATQKKKEQWHQSEQWLRDTDELRRSVIAYRISQGLPPIMTREETEAFFADIHPDDD